MTDEKLTLSEEHRAELVDASGINPEVVTARGYRTVTSKSTLRRYGFSPSQGGEGPWLYIPLFAPDSDFETPSGYQIKPTRPRVDAQGKVMKYEFPRGSMSVMDVHPSMAGKLADPAVPLYITEGTKKADAAVSHGLLALSVPGVWGWKAGQLPHESWNVIPLQDREVYLAFDSDAVTKAGVWDALRALLDFLQKRGAKARAIILPVLVEGTKTGLDDFLRDQPAVALAAYAVDELPDRPDDEVGRGLVYRSPEGDEYPLANFDARITADIVKDDGLTTEREVEIEAVYGDVTQTFVLGVEEFERMAWNIDKLGSDSILFAGQNIAAKAREAIQAKSIGKEERHVFTHTGWRKIRLRSDGQPEWVYLTPAGAIGKHGLAEHIAVDLGDTMNHVEIPDPPLGDDAVQAVRDSLMLIDHEFGVMPLQLYFAIWRAVLGDTPFGYWMYGSTGVGKSEVAALAQQHWGRELTPQNFMANWMSTENYINEIAFRAKDMILVVDDFKPTGGRSHELRLTQIADRLFRSQGNGAGRGRMRRDLTLAVGHPVRSVLVSTAEELPEGESLLARMIAEELITDATRFDRLDMHQANAVAGQYAAALGVFLKWVAPNYETLQRFVRKAVVEQRKKFMGKHRRTQEAGAHLMVAATIFLQFAEDILAITADQRTFILDRLAADVRESADEQDIMRRWQNPIAQARELLQLGIVQGTIGIDGYPDSNAMAPTVGWFHKEHLYLMTVGFRGALHRTARDNGINFSIGAHRLGQALLEAGWLDQQDSQGNTQVAKYDGKPHRVYKVRREFLEAIGVEEGVDLEIDKIEEDF